MKCRQEAEEPLWPHQNTHTRRRTLFEWPHSRSRLLSLSCSSRTLSPFGDLEIREKNVLTPELYDPIHTKAYSSHPHPTPTTNPHPTHPRAQDALPLPIHPCTQPPFTQPLPFPPARTKEYLPNQRIDRERDRGAVCARSPPGLSPQVALHCATPLPRYVQYTYPVIHPGVAVAERRSEAGWMRRHVLVLSVSHPHTLHPLPLCVGPSFLLSRHPLDTLRARPLRFRFLI